DEKIQELAYKDLLNNGTDAKNGAIVALDPASGAILAMATTPSFDPNQIVGNNTTAAQKAFDALNKDKSKPLLNRATQDVYSPGSTMKVIVSAAALTEGDYTPQTVIPAGPKYTPIPGGGFTMINDVP